MDALELLEWRVLERIDPWGQTRDDWRIAKLGASLASFLGAKKADEKAIEASELLLVFDAPPGSDEDDDVPEAPKQSAASIEKWLLAAAKANRNGVIVRKRSERPPTTPGGDMPTTTQPTAPEPTPPTEVA